MLDIKKVQSVNKIDIVGTLSELDIKEGSYTKDGTEVEYVSSKATIRVDQEINGKVVENEIVVNSFANKYKRDGNENSIYNKILNWKEDFVSLAAAEDKSEATRVSISNATLSENIWIDPASGNEHSTFQISTNFMNKARTTDVDGVSMQFTGICLNKSPETKDDEETGRLKVKMGLIGYNGKIDVITFIAETPQATSFVENNWEQGDTVPFTVVPRMTYSTKITKIEQAFGPAIEKKSTISVRELIIDGGNVPYTEDQSYDSGDIKLALENRKTMIENKKSKNKKTTKAIKSDFPW